MEAETIRSHLPRIARLTDENDHTGALMQLAVLCGHEQVRRCLQGVRTIQNAEGEMPDDIIRYRHSLEKRLLRHIETHDEALAGDVRKSL